MSLIATFQNILHSDGLSMTASTARTTDNTQSSWNGRSTNQSELQNLLDTRSGTHGRFKFNAKNAQELKDWARTWESWPDMTPEMREAIDFVFSKFGRISEKARVKDHWKDIAGYAMLAHDSID